MFQKPSECGGFSHVLDVLEEYGEKYQRLILKEFDTHGSNIDRSRLGFYFESVMNIKNTILDQWANQVQRGSSRVFMPGGEFSPYFSERWCISINMEYLQQYELEIETWVEGALAGQESFRQAVHIILKSISVSEYLKPHMIMKGGMLLAFVTKRTIYKGYRLLNALEITRV